MHSCSKKMFLGCILVNFRTLICLLLIKKKNNINSGISKIFWKKWPGITWKKSQNLFWNFFQVSRSLCHPWKSCVSACPKSSQTKIFNISSIIVLSFQKPGTFVYLTMTLFNVLCYYNLRGIKILDIQVLIDGDQVIDRLINTWS